MTIITKKTPLHIPSMDTFLSDRKFFEITIPPRINLQAYRDDEESWWRIIPVIDCTNVHLIFHDIIKQASYDSNLTLLEISLLERTNREKFKIQHLFNLLEDYQEKKRKEKNVQKRRGDEISKDTPKKALANSILAFEK